MNDADFLLAFENCTLPFAEWKHRAHVKVAYLYLRQFPLEQALEKIRGGIRRYNVATNTPETLDRGYHETITQAWTRLIHFTLCEQGAAATAQEFFEQNPQLTNKGALLLFYSRERITSWRAKVEFVEPDLMPFPKMPKS
ncbi:MAG: hypothetical protein QOD03_748 [Verrucomicrobiota bacterium]|jgi:hypothetical protein